MEDIYDEIDIFKSVISHNMHCFDINVMYNLQNWTRTYFGYVEGDMDDYFILVFKKNSDFIVFSYDVDKNEEDIDFDVIDFAYYRNKHFYNDGIFNELVSNTPNLIHLSFINP